MKEFMSDDLEQSLHSPTTSREKKARGRNRLRKPAKAPEVSPELQNVLNIKDQVTTQNQTATSENQDQPKPQTDQTLEEIRQRLPENIANMDAESLAREHARASQEQDFSNLAPKPTFEELLEVEQALESGIFRGAKVVRETTLGGERVLVLEDPKTGKEITYRPGAKEQIGLYYVRDMNPSERTTKEGAQKYIESILRRRELNADLPISGDIEQSLIATLQQDLAIPIAGTPAAAIVFDAERKALFDIDEREIMPLISQARARIHYHNANIIAKNSPKDLASEFQQMVQADHKEILNRSGVRLAIQEMIRDHGSGEGEYFRLNNKDRNGDPIEVTDIHGNLVGIKDARVTSIKEMMRSALPAGMSAADKEYQVNLDFELAEKAMMIFGESAYYDGIVDKDGRWIEMKKSGAPGDPPYAADLEAYSRYFEEHWDDIDFGNEQTGAGGSLSGSGSSQLKQAYWFPIILQKPSTATRGEVEFLRKYAYTWTPSFIRFQTANYKARENMLDFIDHLSDDYYKYFTWTGIVSSVMDTKSQFAGKGRESLLNVALKDPASVDATNPEKTIPPTLENYFKTEAAFNHLGFQEKQKAMARLLKGVLEYAGTGDAKNRYVFGGWNQNIKNEAIYLVMKQHLISRKDARKTKKDLGVWSVMAALEDFWPEFWGGFKKSLFLLLRAIRTFNQ